MTLKSIRQVIEVVRLAAVMPWVVVRCWSVVRCSFGARAWTSAFTAAAEALAKLPFRRTHYRALGILAAVAVVCLSQIAVAHTVPFTAGWLRVNRTSGRVMITQGTARVAKVGDRLSRIGDALETGASASAILQLDDGIGTINVAENTYLEIRKLNRLRSGARRTTLDLKQGQVRLNVRKFTNPESRLEIQSPAGVAAVRGTEYGISIAPDGRMVVATESGLVTAANQGAVVFLEPGFGSRLRPTELPSPPLPLDRELWLKTKSTQINSRVIHLQGQIDPLNQVVVAGREVDIDDGGYFEAVVPLPNSTSLFDFRIVVKNALGESRYYPLLNWE